ncbi:hypothetical protein EVJ50_01365 [Synechococcus sp. RSCCF101]|uniref:hypothetical protein n=1 Tax=Synechococcus sp. RSCCF101 TaxID=2511069 RepID=UPI001244BCCE|nr:hypothetical protein [Synechococcus sp. RSCCF101]QEY31102.1 hypothetical protein EVJ50_01365 [Synechococcus sp. RSCCF101]
MSCRLLTLDACRLAIGFYPPFHYDASGGGGTGTLGPADAQGRQALQFPAADLSIPPLDGRSGRWLGLPLPPGLSIRIIPERLEGSLHRASGALQLQFEARFRFRVGALLSPPDLLVRTCLSTGASQGERHSGSGQPLDGSGQALLVGVAAVPPCGAAWLDRFLGLPDEALAVLRCRLDLPAEPA